MKRRKAEKQAELSEKKVRMPMLSKKNKIKQLIWNLNQNFIPESKPLMF